MPFITSLRPQARELVESRASTIAAHAKSPARNEAAVTREIRTPAMAAGLADQVWTYEEIAGLLNG
jgi:hypothetical protein